MRQRLPAITTLFSALLLASSGALGAQVGAKAGDMTSAQVTAKLQAAGYASVHHVAREGDHFDADATKNGKPVHLHVDAKTGAITPVANEKEEGEEHEEHSPDQPA
jgi:predicted aspartyl protease